LISWRVNFHHSAIEFDIHSSFHVCLHKTHQFQEMSWHMWYPKKIKVFCQFRFKSHLFIKLSGQLSISSHSCGLRSQNSCLDIHSCGLETRDPLLSSLFHQHLWFPRSSCWLLLFRIGLYQGRLFNLGNNFWRHGQLCPVISIAYITCGSFCKSSNGKAIVWIIFCLMSLNICSKLKLEVYVTIYTHLGDDSSQTQGIWNASFIWVVVEKYTKFRTILITSHGGNLLKGK